MRKFTLFLTFFFIVGITFVHAQKRQISGTVTGADDGETLPGVSVVVKGATIGTVTDSDGKYSLEVPADAKVLQFTFVGMKMKEMPIGASNTIDVSMEVDALKVEEVVVTALGISRQQKSLGYAATSVQAEEFGKRSSVDAMNSLQGRIAGVSVTSGGGMPGASTKVIIRGYSSISGNNNPLYVIDGVPIDNSSRVDGYFTGLDYGNRANDINPNDIASMTVLKGAAATALYGPRGANGVIMITTKQGQKNKFTVEYNSSVSVSDVLRLPQMQNTFGQGWSGHWADDENGSWGPKMDGEIRAWGNVVDNAQKIKPFSPVENNLYEFYDYGMQYTNSISLSGGDDKSTFYLSYSNNTADGVIPTDVDKNVKNTIRFNGTREAGIVKASASFNFVRRDGSLNPDGWGGTNAAANLYSELLQIPRDFSIVDFMDYQNDPFNTLDYFYTPYAFNPYYALNENATEFYENRFYGSAALDFQVAEWLKATYRVGVDAAGFNRSEWEAIMRFTPGSVQDAKSVTENPGLVTEENRTTTEFNQDFLFKGNKEFGDFSLNGIVGFSTYQREYKRLTGQITSLVIPGFYNLANTDGDQISLTRVLKKRQYAYFGILDVDYGDFVYLNLTGRQEHSSTLPKDANTFFYPSANVSFLLNEVVPGVGGIFDLFKIRASWGKSGNDADPYSVYPVFEAAVAYVPFHPSDRPGLVFPLAGTMAYEIADDMGNPELEPEITTEKELGFDLRFFKNRIGLDVAFYDRISDGQIFMVRIPGSSGFSRRFINFGEVQNKGIELMANFMPVKNRNFQWGINLTYTKNNSEVLSLPEDAGEIIINRAYDVEMVAKVGEPLGILRAPDYLRVDQDDPNSPIIVNASNGIPEATTEKTDIGDINPDYILGMTNNFKFFKNWDFSFTIDYRPGGYMYSGTADLHYFVGNTTQSLYNDRQPFIVPNSVKENPYWDETDETSPQYVENDVPIDMTNNNAYYYHSQNSVANRWRVIPRDYFKLRDVSLAYTLPKDLTKKSKFQEVQLIVSGRNLLLYTPEDNNFVDPESTSFGNDIRSEFGEFRTGPTVRTFTGSIRVMF
jgi:TonB-linked SusC/RagA family outer membrane protein